jgi:cytochrome b subunit of formate dehydrogenase
MEQRIRSVSGVLWGRVLSAIALVLCVPSGLSFVSIAMEFLGIVLGVTSYALGARRLGVLAIVLCTVSMFVSYLTGQGVGR